MQSQARAPDLTPLMVPAARRMNASRAQQLSSYSTGLTQDTNHCQQHKCLNNQIKRKGKSVCLFLHPSSWPIFIYFVWEDTEPLCTSKSLQAGCYMYSWGGKRHGLYFSDLEISIPKGKMLKKTEHPSCIAWKLSSPKPALQKAHSVCSASVFSPKTARASCL